MNPFMDLTVDSVVAKPDDAVDNFGKVGVLMGGSSAEREISLRTGHGVLEAMKKRGVDAHAFDPGMQSLAELSLQNFDRVFIALHGRFGEDGTIQGALELLGIPYTGSGVMASALAMDKIFTKRIWQTHGLPTPEFRVLDVSNEGQQNIGKLAEELGLPLMLKAPHEGSSLGLVKVLNTGELNDALSYVAQFDATILAEQFITGRELTVSILDRGNGPQALPIIEIIAPDGNYDFANKYNTNVTRYLCPAPLDAALTARIQAMALQAFDALGCTGWGRVDVMLRQADASGEQQPFLLEINTAPGMTDHSLVPMAARAIGLEYDALVMALLANADLKIKRTAKDRV